MLTDILKVLSRKEATLSMSQLALEVGYSLKEIESALEQMEHMGYICREIFGQDCSPSCGMNRCSGHCEDCGFHSPDTFIFWGLTDKGQTMLNQIR